MKRLNKCLAFFLCVIMVSMTPNMVFAIDSVPDSEEIPVYSVPVISNEYSGSRLNFYEIDGKYYLSIDDIKELTRFESEETDTEIILSQGIRDVVIEKNSGHLLDCNIADQGNIGLVQYDGNYLCEGIPMLMYLGAACALREDQALEVMMPTVTIWESIMPDYLDYYFNIAELYGGEDNVKISLACDIISDVLDGVAGHGLFADGDTHLEDALYEILDVDVMKYESVQEAAAAQNQDINDFLTSEGLRTFLEGGSEGTDTAEKLLREYADFYLDGEILKNDVIWQRSYKAGDLETASNLSKEINQQICEQSEIRGDLNDFESVGDALNIGMIALDTAVTSYNLMQYDDDTKNLFSRTINKEIFEYTGYDGISWNNVSDKISNNLSSIESIVQSAALKSVVDYANDEITENGIEFAISKLTSKANIYVTAAKLATFVVSLVNYNKNQAFSADMNAIWLSAVQYDIAQLASYMLVKERDENHFSNPDTLTKLKDMFTLYYRTIIAFSDNIAQSIDGFADENQDELAQYFAGTSGDSVSNYAAIYLYRITNCAVVPIVDYTGLSDTLITADWISQFKQETADAEIMTGVYREVGAPDNQLIIHEVDDNGWIKFELFWYRVASLENISAHIEGNTASFHHTERGYLGVGTLELMGDNKIKLSLQGASSIPYIEPGEYVYKFSEALEQDSEQNILSQEQLDRLKAQLRVPDDLNVTVEQYDNGYWDVGECYLVQVNFLYEGKIVAAAQVDVNTAEPVKEILTYSG